MIFCGWLAIVVNVINSFQEFIAADSGGGGFADFSKGVGAADVEVVVTEMNNYI